MTLYSLQFCYFLFSTHAHRVLTALLSDPLWIKAGSRTHEQLSWDLPPALSGDLPFVDPFTERAAAAGGLSPLKGPREATVTVCKFWGSGGEKAQFKAGGVGGGGLLRTSCSEFKERFSTAVVLRGGSEGCLDHEEEGGG